MTPHLRLKRYPQRRYEPVSSGSSHRQKSTNTRAEKNADGADGVDWDWFSLSEEERGQGAAGRVTTTAGAERHRVARWRSKSIAGSSRTGYN